MYSMTLVSRVSHFLPFYLIAAKFFSLVLLAQFNFNSSDSCSPSFSSRSCPLNERYYEISFQHFMLSLPYPYYLQVVLLLYIPSSYEYSADCPFQIETMAEPSATKDRISTCNVIISYPMILLAGWLFNLTKIDITLIFSAPFLLTQIFL